ncbi:MAG: Calx-beta domain-containing protein [Pseudomonadota bacterium]
MTHRTLLAGARLFLALALLAATLGVAAQPGFVVGTDTTAPGTTAEVTINYLGTGTGVNTMTVDVFYNETVLTPILTNCGRTLGSYPISCVNRVNEFSADAVRISGGSGFTGPEIPTGSLGTIRFAVSGGAAAQTVTLNVGNQEYVRCVILKNDAPKGNCSTIPPSGTVHGAITIEAPASTVPAITSGSTRDFALCPGSSDTLNVGFSETGGDNDGSVDCSLVDGTHYTVAPTSAVVPAGGSTTLVVTATAPTDGSTPSDTLNCNLDGSPGYTLDLTISSGGTPAQVSSSNITVVEGDAGSQLATFEVAVDGPAGCPFEVPVSTFTGTARATDFRSIAETLSFAGNAAEVQIVEVEVFGDEVVERDEFFRLNLGTPTAINVLASGSVRATIENDDSATLTIADGSVTEGDVGVMQLDLPVTLSHAVDRSLTVDFTTADGSASVGDGDYVATSGMLNFDGDAGETQLVSVVVTGDGIAETDEFLVVLLADLDAGNRDVTIARDNATGLILDDDGSPISGLALQPLPTPDRDAGDRVGNAVFTRGDLIVVGVPGANETAGQVLVFDASSGAPQLVATLDAPDGAAAGFGNSVFLHDDLLIVGTDGADAGGKGVSTETITAAVFQRLAMGFSDFATIKASEAQGGGGVALSAGFAFVGSPVVGTVDVFAFAGDGIMPAATLSGPPTPKGQGAGFGSAMNALNDKLAIGAPAAGVGGTVSLYDIIGQNLQLIDEVEPPDAAVGGAFGSAISLSGESMAVGAPGFADTGAAYLFNVPPAGATSLLALVDPPPLLSGDSFGAALALDGDSLLVGAPGTDGGGAVYRFTADRFEQRVSPPAGALEFGQAVAAFAGTIVIGAPATETDAGLALIRTGVVFSSSFEGVEAQR